MPTASPPPAAGFPAAPGRAGRSRLAALLLWGATACACLAAEPEPSERLKVTLEVLMYADTIATKPEYCLTMGHLAYRSVEDLKKGIARLPRGAEVVWSPGCVRFGGEPLDSRAALDDLLAWCRSCGVTFTIIPSG